MGGGISPHTTLPTSAAIQTTMEHEMAGIEPYYTEGTGLSQGYYVRLALLRMAEFSKRALYSLVLRTTKNRAFDIIEKLKWTCSRTNSGDARTEGRLLPKADVDEGSEKLKAYTKGVSDCEKRKSKFETVSKDKFCCSSSRAPLMTQCMYIPWRSNVGLDHNTQLGSTLRSETQGATSHLIRNFSKTLTRQKKEKRWGESASAAFHSRLPQANASYKSMANPNAAFGGAGNNQHEPFQQQLCLV
ncbi:hypothetical protein X797_003702 [Metarhizium robertsii]|uniref:Uncharacterized protein n=2 Tax=Metarhizium robertsii TaxID=568076 RepID=A0A0B2XGS9_METRA|nr:uncharacterized protein MAA_11247 [Metarhizium robertsii ARSEF 23]EXV02580.1 hypothetical protein X797_003702 [Metarhizium robertsii]KHO11169.1 hypothetical protein MAA_11247 [Metarhizium robertsii ARSEF 23]